MENTNFSQESFDSKVQLSNLNDSVTKSRIKVRDLVSAAFLMAVIILFAFTPLGFIRIGLTALTIIHIPVIVGSILLGPRYGAFLGFVFGMTSLLNATFLPDASSFAFSPFYSVGAFQGNAWSLVVCFVPRILVGIVPFLVFKGLSKLLRFKGNEVVSLAVSGVAGALTNTIFVLGFIYLFFAGDFSKLVGTTVDLFYKFLFALIATNGIPEAILAGIIVTAVCKAVLVSQKRIQISKIQTKK